MSPQSQPHAEAHKIVRSFSMDPDRQEILEAFEGASYEAFRLLDEEPGQFDENYRQTNWHRVLRAERNDPGSPLLSQLRRSDGPLDETVAILGGSGLLGGAYLSRVTQDRDLTPEDSAVVSELLRPVDESDVVVSRSGRDLTSEEIAALAESGATAFAFTSDQGTAMAETAIPAASLDSSTYAEALETAQASDDWDGNARPTDVSDNEVILDELVDDDPSRSE